MELPKPHGVLMSQWLVAAKMRMRHAHHLWFLGLSAVLLLVATLNLFPAGSANATPMRGVAADASCAALAGLDGSATNGATWGRTILPGHHAPGGWFGVDVCANGTNGAAPGGADVSCDRMPSHWAKTGCAPGSATSDGYGLTFQCVELIARFSAWAYGDAPGTWVGNAPDLWLPGNHPSDFIMYPNGADHAPVPGDILVWGSAGASGLPWPAGPDGEHGGHIAVVAAVRDGMVITAEQNVKWGSDDHPSDMLALTHVGTHWVLSGSTAHETTLPTYRWRSTMGLSRATYGWLHSVRNTGKFPSAGRQNAPHVAAPSQPPQSQPPHTTTTPPKQASGALPSLASAAVVTSGGTLADAVWSTSNYFGDDPTASDASDGQAHAVARSLGAPPGAKLAVGQSSASVTTQDGSRYTYAVGVNGHLYEAQLTPASLGVSWYDLATPAGLILQVPVVASSFAGGVAVVAKASDGNLWWRAGAPSAFGSWLPLSRPAGVTLSNSFAIAGAPGTGLPLLLAVDISGQLHERIWQPALLGSDGSVAVPAGWSDWLTWRAQPAGVQFSGAFLAIPEAAQAQNWVGAWPDAPLDVFTLDTQGHLWWLRTTALASGWVTRSLKTPVALTSLLASVEVTANPPTVTLTPAASGATPAVTPATATPASAAKNNNSPGPATPQLHIYGATPRATYMAAVALPSQPMDSVGATAWKKLAALPGAASPRAAGVALPVAPGESVLVVPAGTHVMVGGTREGIAALVSSDQTPSGSGGGASAPATWVRLGGVPIAGPFSDGFSSAALDARWNLAGVYTQAAVSHSGVRLVPGAMGVAALLQNAAPGNATVTLRLTLPTMPGGDWNEGLIFYLDSGNWLTLLATSGGHVALCAAAWLHPSPCQVQTVTLHGALWLRLARQGSAITGETSADGNTWQQIGQWTPVSPRSAAISATTSHATPTAPPVTPMPSAVATRIPQAAPSSASAPGTSGANTNTPSSSTLASLAFTSWGVLARGSGSVSEWPLVTDFSVEASPAS